jgi:hypothetical protein
VRKIYRLIPDNAGAKHGLVRVVDEMREDYLFPKEYFVPLRLPLAAGIRLQYYAVGGTANALPSDFGKQR